MVFDFVVVAGYAGRYLCRNLLEGALRYTAVAERSC
jgi:hypothetical protein